MAKQTFTIDSDGAAGSRITPADHPAEAAAATSEAASRDEAGSPALRTEAAPAATAAPEPAPAAAAPAPKKKRRVGRLVLLALLAGAGWFGATEGRDWWTHGRFLVETDDAYVATDITTLAAKVAGYVESVDIAPNQAVKAGDALFHLDAGDYRLALESARNKIASQDAAIARIARQVTAAEAGVVQARAEITAAEASLEEAAAAYARQERLVQTKVSAAAQLEEARAARDRAAAGVAAAKAGLAVAEANVEVLKAQSVEAERARADLQTAAEKAERDLSFAVVRAPFDGIVGNRAVEEGAYVQPGQRLAALVPLTAVHVDANFKETQLAGLKPGQKVELSVDALPDRTIEGTVESFAPATGSVFSLLPPENATGNFTKIIQRLPVRIAIPADVAAEGVLRPGMSVVVGVDTRTGGENRTAALK